MPAREITIINKLGLHARAAAKFVGIAGRFACDVKIGRSKESLVDGKSIMGVMMLAAGQGTLVYLQTQGADAEQAMTALVELIENRFDEGE
jgi:phosphocarrier protein